MTDAALPPAAEPVAAPAGPSRWARFLAHPATVLVVAFVLNALAGVGLGAAFKVLGLFDAANARGETTVLLVHEVIRALAAVVVALLVARFLERRSLDEYGARRLGPELGGGFAFGALLLSFVVGLFALFGWYRVVGTQFDGGALTEWFVLCLFIAIFEEVFFRGIVFRLFERWAGSYVALAISGGLFGLVHIGNENATWVSSLAIAIEAGLLLGVVYMLTRTLWAPIGMHWAWNFFEGPVFGTPVSGMKIHSLLVSVTQGPERLTGGDFGPEASLPMMIVGTGISLALIVLARRRGEVRPLPGWKTLVGLGVFFAVLVALSIVLTLLAARLRG